MHIKNIPVQLSHAYALRVLGKSSSGQLHGCRGRISGDARRNERAMQRPQKLGFRSKPCLFYSNCLNSRISCATSGIRRSPDRITKLMSQFFHVKKMIRALDISCQNERGRCIGKLFMEFGRGVLPVKNSFEVRCQLRIIGQCRWCSIGERGNFGRRAFGSSRSYGIRGIRFGKRAGHRKDKTHDHTMHNTVLSGRMNNPASA